MMMFNPHAFGDTYISDKLKLGKNLLAKLFRPKGFLFLFIVLVGIGYLDPSSITFAEFGATSQNNILQSLGQILSLIIKMLTFISVFIIAVAGELMSSKLIIGDVAGEGLRHVWVYSRNITNIGFVLILVYLSIANLFSLGDSSGGWTIKEKLPKIILSLIAINFSFLGFKVLIQAVDVGSVAVLSIADTALEEKQAKTVKDILNSPVYNLIKTDANKETDKAPFYQVFNKVMGCKATENTAVEKNQCMFFIDIDAAKKSETTKNILVAFGVNLMHLERLPALASGLGSLTDVIDSTFFSAIMALMFVVALIAMFIVMLFRVAALWFFVAFSPLIVASGIMGFGGGGSEISSKIVTYLIIPLKISGIFAVTFVMMGVLGDYKGSDATAWLVTGNSLGNVSLFTILWQILTVAIFWRGAFWALEGTHAEGIVKGIQSGAEKVGGYALKTATIDQPLFKTGNMDKKASLTTISRIPRMLDSKRATDLQEQQTSMMSALGASKESIQSQKELTNALNTYRGQEGLTNKQGLEVLSKLSLGSLKKLPDSDLDKVVAKIATPGKENALKGILTTYQTNSDSAGALDVLTNGIQRNSVISSSKNIKFNGASSSAKDNTSGENLLNPNTDSITNANIDIEKDDPITIPIKFIGSNESVDIEINNQKNPTEIKINSSEGTYGESMLADEEFMKALVKKVFNDKNYQKDNYEIKDEKIIKKQKESATTPKSTS